MNTRLQVEHPVTEAITGLDLVECQIRIAAGQPLAVTQEQIKASGWAIEARINAEDPANNYRPETGPIKLYREPSCAGIRVDSGIRQDSVVSPYYDPMLAKVIGQGADREQARQRLLRGLGDFTIAGTVTNLEFLSSILRHENFSCSALTTNYLKDTFVESWKKPPGNDTLLICAAVASAMSVERLPEDQHVSPWQSLSGFRVLNRAGQVGQSRIVLGTPEGRVLAVTISGSRGMYQTSIATPMVTTQTVYGKWLGSRELQIEIDGVSRLLSIDFDNEEIILHCSGQTVHYRQVDEQELALGFGGSDGSGEHRVLATLPGQVTEVRVTVGDQVSAGDTLVVLDSMKLLHNLNAQTNGTVQEIFCAAGESVDGGAVLIELAPEKPTP
jgi:3-methylcrotonyl-CoA carboxylase alpha subunit